MKKKYIVTIVIAAVIAAVALSLIIYGRVTYKESGFAEGWARWDKSRIPLSVTCRGYESDRNGDCSIAEDIVGVINHRLGFDALIYGVRSDETEASVKITIGVPQNVGVGDGRDDEGNLFHSGENTGLYSVDGVAYKCEILTSNTGYDLMLWLVIYHGFGHCFGLAHDDFESSIMRPVQRDTMDLRTLPWFTDYDRKIIRERYMYSGYSSEEVVDLDDEL